MSGIELLTLSILVCNFVISILTVFIRRKGVTVAEDALAAKLEKDNEYESLTDAYNRGYEQGQVMLLEYLEGADSGK